MRCQYDMYQSMVVVNKDINKEYFLNRAGAKAGYAKSMFSRIYDSIFSEAINLEDVFERYYAIEYKDIYEFLYNRYCLSRTIVNKIRELKQNNADNVIIAFDELNYGDPGIVEFAFSESMYDRITQILLMA